MWVKRSRGRAGRSILRKQGVVRLLATLIFLALSVFLVLFGAYLHDEDYLHDGWAIVRSNYRIPLNWARSLTARPPHLFVDIKYEDYQRLAFNREVAIRRGALLPDVRDEVPATLRWGDQRVRARVRLKGDLPDHWKHPWLWSLRIKTRGDTTAFGMKQFSIQRPRTRGFLNDWFFHRFLRFNGLIGLRYDFLQVTVNGRHLGVYALEEHYEKRLVEHNRRREGPLFRADTYFYWHQTPGLAKAVYGTAVDAYQTNRLAADPVLTGQFRMARNLFEGFREGEVPVDQVFDLEKFARFFAILDLVGNYHAGGLDNLVFYYNPVSARIEPVAGDSQAIKPVSGLLGTRSRLQLDESAAEEVSTWHDLLFRDPGFFAVYVSELDRIADPALLGAFFEEHEEEYDEALRILHKGFPWYSFEPSREVLSRNQRYIGDYLAPVKSVQAYYRGTSATDGSLELEIASIHALPVEILGLSLVGSEEVGPSTATVLPGQRATDRLEYRRVGFPPPPGFEGADPAALQLRVRPLGGSHTLVERVHPWRHRDLDLLGGDLVRQPPNFDTFDFLTLDSVNRQILVEPGDWTVDRDLVLPAAHLIVATPGTRLDLVAGAKILSFSPLRFTGTSQAPIVIESSDGSGQGLVVLEAGERSLLEQVRFRGLSFPRRTGWELTGAVTFYESPVTITDSHFEGNQAEDALNVIRGRFEISGTVFEGAASDALDVDFGDGRILRTSFVDCTNDGIDVSGSVVELEDVLVNGAGDKGVSAGERSRLTGRAVSIVRAEVAIASKDLSTIRLDGVEIRQGRVGLTAYRKKPEFGSAEIHALGAELSDLEQEFLIEVGSVASVNGEAIDASHQNVAELMYGVEYGRSSG